MAIRAPDRARPSVRHAVRYGAPARRLSRGPLRDPCPPAILRHFDVPRAIEVIRPSLARRPPRLATPAASGRWPLDLRTAPAAFAAAAARAFSVSQTLHGTGGVPGWTAVPSCGP